ncbi:MAG: 30S processome protein Utp24 [Thermosphaera sp.]
MLDTNILLLIADGFPVLEEIEEQVAFKPEYIVIAQTLKELETIGGREGGLMKKKCELAIKIARERCKIVDHKPDEFRDADDAILDYATSYNAAIATNDRELRRRAREKGLSEIYLREESQRIVVEGLIEY